jgi:hypothetical protein
VKTKATKKAVKKTAKKSTANVKATTAQPTPEPSIVAAHQWTNGGNEVFILKCVSADGQGYGGFQYPLTVGASVEAPDWNPRKECGGGLHGWPWGIGIGGGKEPDWNGRWLVLGAASEDIVDLGDKCKAQKAIVRFASEPKDWQAATNFILSGQIAWVQQAASGAASATGWRGAASATGASGAASATGWSGAASATGESGAASATGASGAASATGWSSIAVVTGPYGRVRGGKYSAIALAFVNVAAGRQEMRCAEIGCGDGSDGKLKANVWYRLDESGAFVEVR